MAVLYNVDDKGEVKVTTVNQMSSNSYIDITDLDPVVLETVLEIIKRSRVGVGKYGTTLYENNLDDFLQHAKEEALDLANYLTKLQLEKRSGTVIPNT